MSAFRFLTRLPARPIASLSRTIHSSLPRLADPYVLPLSNPDLASMASRSPQTTTSSDDWPMPQPLDRTGEDEKTLRARLVYQCRKRGTLESDLILATFARDQLQTMPVAEMQEFDKLLDEPDWDIYYWAVQKREPPPRWAGTPLLAKLVQHAKNEGKEVRMMPALAQHSAE